MTAGLFAAQPFRVVFQRDRVVLGAVEDVRDLSKAETELTQQQDSL